MADSTEEVEDSWFDEMSALVAPDERRRVVRISEPANIYGHFNEIVIWNQTALRISVSCLFSYFQKNVNLFDFCKFSKHSFFSSMKLSDTWMDEYLFHRKICLHYRNS